MPSQNSGADIQGRSPKPSVDLATVVDLLASAISPSNNTGKVDDPDPKNRQAFIFDPQKQRLRVCTSAVLRRLFADKDFQQAFDLSQNGGFIQDFSHPAFGNRAKIGGCLAEDNAKRLPAATDKLISAIDEALLSALPEETSLAKLLLDQPVKHLNQLAKVAGTAFKDQANTANLIPIAFPNPDIQPNNQPKFVAKVISALETIEANNYFEQMCSAVRTHAEEQLDWDEDDIESAIASLTGEKEKQDSQLNRFLNFLDDEALARVRLNTTFQIMEEIAKSAQTSKELNPQLLAEYVNRVIHLVTSAKQNGYTVNLAAHFGIAAEFELQDYLSKATFYYCLPVWAESKTQLFEKKVRNQTSNSFGVAREVTYRFRVNGKNPEFGKPAFEARLQRIKDELLPEEETTTQQPGKICRCLAELIFLAIVVPGNNQETIPNSTPELLAFLKSEGREGIRQLIQNLLERAESMEKIGTALISILRTQGQTIIAQVQRRSTQQFICVKRSVIEWSRLEGAEPGVRDLLVGASQGGREQVEWFKNIEICDKPETPGLLFSVKVTTEISEHNLAIDGDAYKIQAQRLLPEKLLQICWVPYHSEKREDGQWTYKPSVNALVAKGWVLPAAIQIEYETKTLATTKQTDQSKQLHAAAVSAFSVLVYCCLWRIIHTLKQGNNGESIDFTTLMLRLQETGRESEENSSGESYVYAAAQTLEAILAEETSIRMQGIVLGNIAKQTKETPWIKKGIFNALLSAFPLIISTQNTPAEPKIGLISYATRPCNETTFLNEDEKSYLFLTQSYIATAVNEPFCGYKIRSERMQSDVIDSPEQFKKQRLVQEEIAYLKSQGCQHIILLSHAYGGRRINRVADYNSSLNPKEFMEEVYKNFPDLTIYTMLQDVFPATRLHSRDLKNEESGFEIPRAENHTSFVNSLKIIRDRDIIPVYTFATLHAIEQQNRPQSGFCVYFLVSDSRISSINWTERARQHLINPEQDSSIHPCLITVLRGLHFIEAEQGVKGAKKNVTDGQLMPVLDPFSWISPTTVEGAGEVLVLKNRRKGKVLLSYPALLTHVSQVLHRRK
ncbi:MAG TPA: hypothetical protein V6D15_01735 [Oculatellaceae cyanobacterium]|jgi:hypothetical protein